MALEQMTARGIRIVRDDRTALMQGLFHKSKVNWDRSFFTLPLRLGCLFRLPSF